LTNRLIRILGCSGEAVRFARIPTLNLERPRMAG
jgi:hypothetical protein